MASWNLLPAFLRWISLAWWKACNRKDWGNRANGGNGDISGKRDMGALGKTWRDCYSFGWLGNERLREMEREIKGLWRWSSKKVKNYTRRQQI